MVKRLKVSSDHSRVMLKTPFPQDADEKFESSEDDEDEKSESE